MSHDYETYSHSVNVFVLSATLLMATGCYRRDELLDYGIGAVLHDIGKVDIPGRILNKPGKLNPKEMNRIRRHPEVGHQICLPAGLSQYVHDVILYHHEKLDGSGYPKGLTAKMIGSHVRAVTMVDIYDALTSKRPYAPSLAPFDALSLMRREFQGKIDPDLFELFVKILGGML
jgi:HD-GYP domain-containing protein (c-di-GMP phosphodiesterase class II)